jgi:hypothetical protein
MTDPTMVVAPTMSERDEALKIQERQRAINQMLARSATDRTFRDLLLNDAHAAFREYNVEIAPGLDVRFIENKADATIVLPDPIDNIEELSESELAQLNGGSDSPDLIKLSLAVVEISTMLCAGAVVSGAAIYIGWQLI